MKRSVSVEVSPTVVVWAIVLIAAAAFFWLTAPLWHWLLFSLLWRNIVILVVTVVLMALFIGGVSYASEEEGCTGWAVALVALLLLVGFFYLAKDTYGRAVAYGFEPEITSELPDTTNVRYIPYEVSLAFAQARQENPTKKTGDIDPVEISGEFYWLAPRIPNGIGNVLFSHTDGVMLVAEDGTVDFEPQLFKCGEGMAVTDAIAWQLFRKRFAAEYPEIFYLKIDGEWTAMAPYVTYRFVFPVFVPQWGGVMLVHPNCTVEDLTPQQAQADARLEGQRLFPEAMAKVYSLSWGYRFGGLWNILWIHREQVEVADLEGTVNEMPYFVPTTWGPQWVMAVEPSGPSQSIFKIFWFDTHSGEAQLTEFTEDALIGPNRGAQFAKSETPGYTWREKGKEEEAGTYLAIEPRPIIRDGTLYWQYSVTTFKYTGVGLTVLVNSRDAEEVLHFCSRVSLTRWLEGKGGPDPVPCARAAEVPEVAPAPAVQVPISDLAALTEEELYQLLRQIADELQRRGK